MAGSERKSDGDTRSEGDGHVTNKSHVKNDYATTNESGDIVFETLWGRVLEAWDDPKTHGALLEYALRKEHLPDAAGRYRALLDDAEKKERAQKQLDAIVLAATQLMLAMKTPPPPKTPRWMNLGAAIVSIVLLTWVAYLVLGGHHGR